MAFDYTQFQRWSMSGALKGNTQWSYTSTTETMAAITASGYFNMVNDTNTDPVMRVGDIIWVVPTDDAGYVIVNSLDPVTTSVFNVVLGPGDVGTANIADGAVTTPKIADLAVTTAKLDDLSVTAGKIGANAVITAKINNLAVTTAKLDDVSVTTGKLADQAVTAAKITDATITATQIAPATIVGANIAATTIAAGNIANGTITTTQISNTAGITGTQIANTTIVAGNIANATITGAKLVNGTITTTQIAAATITGSNLAAGTITNTQIATGTITGTQIAATTVAAGNIVNQTITAAQIANLTITNAQIANDTIDTLNLDPKVIQYVRVPISSAQFLAMYATPLLLIPTSGAGTLINVINAQLVMTFNSVQYTVGGNVFLQYANTVHGAGAPSSVALAAATVNAWAADTAIRIAPDMPEAALGNVNGQSLYISNDTAAFLLGNSAFVLYISYNIVTL